MNTPKKPWIKPRPAEPLSTVYVEGWNAAVEESQGGAGAAPAAVQPERRPPLTEMQIETIYLATVHTAEAEQMSKKNWLQLGVVTAEGWHGIVDKATGS